MSKKQLTLIVLLGVAFLKSQAQFAPGKLVVTRIGDGTTALTAGTSVPVNLYEFTATDANQIVPGSPKVGIGSTVTGNRLTVVGNGKGEGAISLSADGKYISLMGYDQATGVAAATCNAGNKVIGRLNPAGIFEYSAGFPSTASGSAKNVATVDGNNYYTNINNIGYQPWNSVTAPAVVASPGSNLMHVAVSDGQLYFYTSYGNVSYTNTALPVGTSATATALQLSLSLDGRSFAFLNTDNNTATGYGGAGYDVLYLANRINGLEKYYYVAATATTAAKWLPANAQFQLKINITNGGSGYTSAPVVTIGDAWAPNFAYAANTFVTNTVSGVSRIYFVKTAGTSGATGPTHLSGDAADGTAVLTALGYNSTATATINGGIVTDIIINQGNAQQAPVSPYNMVAPSVTLSGGGGSGAAAVSAYPPAPISSVAAITAAMVGGQPVIYAVTGDGTSVNNKLVAITDGSGSVSSAMTSANSPVVNLVAAAGANYAFRGVAFAPNDSPLPLNLTSFSGNLVNNKAVLRWTTTGEVNTRAFTVEKSISNPNNFMVIGTIPAKNTQSAHNYVYEDGLLVKGIDYYRLKLNDQDGSYKYSPIIALKISREGKALGIFPNPVVNNFTVIHTPAKTNAVFQVIAVSGRLVGQYTVAENATQTLLDASPLQPGQYIIRYVNGPEASFSRIIKVLH